ncbi:hypothetical protein PENANT_c025G08262 [Penicillium antarcticum]|uniref:Pentacotripeptide-repeat region of PRORP domain-containing protein n=1 Tax=Penicillium antarcticum TaxID=416450 RepID=A0A1V6PXV5_9EURO|nr:uncharacterized protein N7508_000364 [Penicillium antarcticum]KAJ5320081.1 hypothetical protein N7508_000364 [Penicillium antarcticum]OQD81849.1 hypothetical protein PENANT_c025G08262 [Penicillium antarcticum]
MTFRFPGSLVNRALRSKLLTAQQHRASVAGELQFQQTQTWLSASLRFYSERSFQRSFQRSSGRNDSYRKTSRPGPGRFEKDEQKSMNRGRGSRKTFNDDLSSKRDRDLLMAIASGKETLGGRYDVDVDGDIAESEALDKEAAEKWSAEAEKPATEASENDASQDQVPRVEAEVETANGDAPKEPAPSVIKSLKVPNKVITEELKWLSDPRDFAERVSRILHAGDPALAAALIRTGTKQGMRCDVAWNTLLQYCMDQNHPQAAFKFYNDMKKRGRRPLATTYTIMLKGFSSASESPSIVKTAASVYRSISSPNSGVNQSIIHTNAMLTVCQRHNDMDRLWKIAGDLPEEGPGAPDAATYTIILGAVQFAARKDIQKMSPEEIDRILERKALAVTEGKRIWADVAYRWKNQALELDNSVVNAMASLLLDGASDLDCYNVMELYKQTMGIPILQKRPIESESSSRRRITREETQTLEQSQSKREDSMEDVPFVDENNQIIREAEPGEEAQPLAEEPEELEDEAEEPEEEESFEELFRPVVPDLAELSFLKPDSKELTLLLNACFTITHGTEAGVNYWKLLTIQDPKYLIEPDSVSYLQYFRLLRISRSSKVGVAALRDQMIPSGVANGKAFHVALSICRRDRRNHSVLQHANELMSLMGKALILPDLRVLEGYLELIQILSSQPSVLLHLRGLDMEDTSSKSRLQDIGRKIQAKLRLAAVATLLPYTAQLHEAMELGGPSKNSRWSEIQNQKDNVNGAAAVKILSRIRLIVDDTLMDDYKSFVSKAERKMLMEESKMLKKYSDKAVIQSFRGKTVYPTPEQKRFGGERIKRFQLEARKNLSKKQFEEGSYQEPKEQAEKAPEWDESFPKKD